MTIGVKLARKKVHQLYRRISYTERENMRCKIEERFCPVENVSLIEATCTTSLHLSPRPCWTNTTRSPWPSRKTVWSHLVNMNVTSPVASLEEQAPNGGDFMEMAQTLFHTRRGIRFRIPSIILDSILSIARERERERDERKY